MRAPRRLADEIQSLSDRFGSPKEIEHVLPDVGFGPVNRSREAEVAMAIRRPNGRILLHTKEIYPAGVYRLPTGGIERREPIERALLRETREETELEVEVRRFVATLSYLSASRNLVFRSHLFLLDEVGGKLLEQEPGEGITGWIEADPGELVAAADRLRASPGSWAAWGAFRALVIDALLPAIETA